MKNLIKIFVLCAFFVCCESINAKHIETCQVKYKKEIGWSKYYNVDVIFLTGTELNKATKTYDYSSFDSYAVIFWGKDQASVIEIDSPYMVCGSNVTNYCIPRYTNMEGYDQRRHKWEICCQYYC